MQNHFKKILASLGSRHWVSGRSLGRTGCTASHLRPVSLQLNFSIYNWEVKECAVKAVPSLSALLIYMQIRAHTRKASMPSVCWGNFSVSDT